MTFPVGVYNPQNKKINFSTFHNGLMGGVNSNNCIRKIYYVKLEIKQVSFLGKIASISF